MDILKEHNVKYLNKQILKYSFKGHTCIRDTVQLFFLKKFKQLTLTLVRETPYNIYNFRSLCKAKINKQIFSLMIAQTLY